MRQFKELLDLAEGLSRKEQLELAEFLIVRLRRTETPAGGADPSDFFGKITFPEDGLEYQTRVREEWAS